jgi:hypothetical protein
MQGTAKIDDPQAKQKPIQTQQINRESGFIGARHWPRQQGKMAN